MSEEPNPPRPRVALLVTCLVDMFRPAIGFAAVKLMEDAGCIVEVPEQTCCGQPGYNSGDDANARLLAMQVIERFEAYDYLVAPSGSCAGMIHEHYPRLFDTDAGWRQRAQALAAKSYELTSFLTDVLELESVQASFEAEATYHDSCAGLRELNVKRQPRSLLESVQGLHVREMEDSEVCCGFGGTFCVKYPAISERMVSEKGKSIAASGAQCLLGGDLGCLLNMAGHLTRVGAPVRTFHVAEVLAGMADGRAIGERDDEGGK